MIVVDVAARGEGWDVSLPVPGAGSPLRMLRAKGPKGRLVPLPDQERRPAPPADDTSWSNDAAAVELLLDRADRKVATCEELRALGRHLFDALLGPPAWAAIEAVAPVSEPIPVGLRLGGDDPLHGLYWELLHDDAEHLALRKTRPLALVRIVRDAPSELRSITGLPRLLFAAGTGRNEPDVRAGSELAGLLRGLEREGGFVHTRVAAEVSVDKLRHACKQFKPDIIHLAAHGRWDPHRNAAVLELRSEDGTTSEDTRADEIGEVIGSPAAVLLSACSTAGARTGGTSMAAELVAGGVPLVFAMAGEISDHACRVFSRSVMAAIQGGVPVLRAVADGRRAAFLKAKSAPQTIDWALPCVVSSRPIPADMRLVPPGPHPVQSTIGVLGLLDRPVFAGREEFLDVLQDLLAPTGLSQLFLLSGGPALGGSRVLKELGAAALRRGDLPVMLGPYTASDGPTTFGKLLLALQVKIIEIAQTQEVPPPLGLRDVARDIASGPADEDAIREGITAARATLFALRDLLAARPDPVIRPDGVPVLLFDDVQHYDATLGILLSNLKGNGFGAEPPKVPVVLFAKQAEGVGPELARYEARPGWAVKRSLSQLTDLDQDRDLWTCLAWYLNPEPKTDGALQKVYAPVTPPDVWSWIVRLSLADRGFYEPSYLRSLAEKLVDKKLWTESDDNAVLAAHDLLFEP